jgi:hypothetical protein
MEYDVYDLYERHIREEMALGEYDDTIVQWYLHGETVVKSYIGTVLINHSAHELIPAV